MAEADPATTVPHDLVAALRAATQRLVRGVDGLTEEAWHEPSLLPAWSRAHLLAHLTLNAEAIAGCIEAALDGDRLPMYASPAGRDDAIEDLARERPDDIRERLLGSTTRVATAVAELPDELRAVEVERHPGGPRFALGAAAAMRLREVEIHHADLGTGYTSAQWPPGFAPLVLDALGERPAPPGDLVLAPVDDRRRWSFGTGGEVVTGPLHALAWWATGRPAGPALTCESGVLPRIETW